MARVGFFLYHARTGRYIGMGMDVCLQISTQTFA